jgi:hypothetical protein
MVERQSGVFEAQSVVAFRANNRPVFVVAPETPYSARLIRVDTEGSIMRPPRSPSLTSPLLRWALARARRGEVNTQTVVIIILAIVGGVMLLACLVGIALLLPAIQGARGAAQQAAQRTQGRNNLQQIGLALHNYHDVHGQFPPSGIHGEDGTAYHGWQTMLLPYVDQAPLYNQINFDVPWDDPANSGLFFTVVPIYLHPSISESPVDSQGRALSHYAGNSQLFLPNGTMRMRDIIDGTSNTMMAGEVAAGFKPWGDPSNVRDPAAGLAIGGNTFHGPAGQNGTQILLGDGSVRFVQDNVNPAILQAIATPAGGEPVGQF